MSNSKEERAAFNQRQAERWAAIERDFNPMTGERWPTSAIVVHQTKKSEPPKHPYDLALEDIRKRRDVMRALEADGFSPEEIDEHLATYDRMVQEMHRTGGGYIP